MLIKEIEDILNEVEKVLQKNFLCRQDLSSFYVSLRFYEFAYRLSYTIFEQVYAKYFDNFVYEYDFAKASKMAKEKTIEEVASLIENKIIEEFSKKIRDRG